MSDQSKEKEKKTKIDLPDFDLSHQSQSDEDDSKDRLFVTALARGLDILRSFSPEERALRNQDIVKRTGLPKATVFRLTHTLIKLGYLNYSEETGRLHLGTGVLSLGYSLLNNSNILKTARPYMQELADYSHSAVSLGSRDRLNMVYLDSCRCTDTTFTLNLEAGASIPLATTAMGKAHICALPEEERDYVMDHIRRHNESDWPKIKGGIEQALRDYERWGFCFSLGDWRHDVNGVAVSMRPVPGTGILTFNCGGPSFLLRRHMLEDDLGPRLVLLTRNIEAKLAQI